YLNQYTSPADKMLAQQLNDRLREAGVAPKATATTADTSAKKAATTAKPDAKALLNQAREALKRNDLDLAEKLAKESERADKSVIPQFMHPWSDTPAKVLRDVQAARAKKNTPAKKPETTAKESVSPFNKMKGIFSRNNTPETPKKTEENVSAK